MNCDNKLNVRGEVTIKRFDKDKNLIDSVIRKNLIVNSGLTFFCNKILDIPNATSVGYIGVGNGYKTPALEDTDLVKNPGEQDAVDHVVEYKSIRYKRVLEPNAFTVEALFIEGEFSNIELAEVGLFSDALDGYGYPTEMIARTVLAGNTRFTKSDTDYLSISWTITFG